MKITYLVLLCFITSQLASSIQVHKKKVHFDDSTIKTATLDQYKILKTYKRPDTQYYTQGLRFSGPNTLIESTGLYGESRIQNLKIDGEKIIVTDHANLDNMYFGEGCDYVGKGDEKRIYQLTWQEGKIFAYNPVTLERTGSFEMPSEVREGWGFATRDVEVDGKNTQEIYMTDGSHNIYIADTKLNVKNTLQAHTSDGRKIDNLNELEFIKGKLWANIYMTNDVVVVNPDNGLIEKIIRFDGLQKMAENEAERRGLDFGGDYCLNGIAYDPSEDRILITGKKWPLMWEIEVPGSTD